MKRGGFKKIKMTYKEGTKGSRAVSKYPNRAVFPLVQQKTNICKKNNYVLYTTNSTFIFTLWHPALEIMSLDIFERPPCYYYTDSELVSNITLQVPRFIHVVLLVMAGFLNFKKIWGISTKTNISRNFIPSKQIPSKYWTLIKNSRWLPKKILKGLMTRPFI